MVAYNSPAGFTVTEDTIEVGDPAVLVVHPDTRTSYAFTSPAGFTETGPETEEPVAGAPSTGQIWPRGNP